MFRLGAAPPLLCCVCVEHPRLEEGLLLSVAWQTALLRRRVDGIVVCPCTPSNTLYPHRVVNALLNLILSALLVRSALP